MSAAALVRAAILMLALSVLLATAASATPASAPGPAGGAACMTALLNMSDCLSFVLKGSTAARPEAPCCPELAGMVGGSHPTCLCALLSGAADSYGIAIDNARALALPGICRVAAPPVSTCRAFGYHVHLGPAAAPSGAPPPTSGISPTAEGPQFPGSTPLGPSPATASHADMATLSILPLAMMPLAIAAAIVGGIL